MESLKKPMKQLTKSLEFSIDYNGQRLSYILGRLIVILALLIGLPIGFFMQDFSITTYIIIGGGVIASIVSVPNWPMYNRMNIQWSE